MAGYLIAEDKPVMYCEQWVESNAGFDVGSMSGQRISELLAAFGCPERNSFLSVMVQLETRAGIHCAGYRVGYIVFG